MGFLDLFKSMPPAPLPPLRTDWYGQCEECGDSFVTRRSHRCKGLDAGKPWTILPVTSERLTLWSRSEAFRKWARRNSIQLNYRQLVEDGISLTDRELKLINKEN
jgi:hypothetical protein